MSTAAARGGAPLVSQSTSVAGASSTASVLLRLTTQARPITPPASAAAWRRCGVSSSRAPSASSSRAMAVPPSTSHRTTLPSLSPEASLWRAGVGSWGGWGGSRADSLWRQLGRGRHAAVPGGRRCGRCGVWRRADAGGPCSRSARLGSSGGGGGTGQQPGRAGPGRAGPRGAHLRLAEVGAREWQSGHLHGRAAPVSEQRSWRWPPWAAGPPARLAHARAASRRGRASGMPTT
jgi:hypothetical protein